MFGNIKMKGTIKGTWYFNNGYAFDLASATKIQPKQNNFMDYSFMAIYDKHGTGHTIYVGATDGKEFVREVSEIVDAIADLQQSQLMTKSAFRD